MGTGAVDADGALLSANYTPVPVRSRGSRMSLAAKAVVRAASTSRTSPGRIFALMHFPEWSGRRTPGRRSISWEAEFGRAAKSLMELR